jgi:hypothetical protein
MSAAVIPCEGLTERGVLRKRDPGVKLTRGKTAHSGEGRKVTFFFPCHKPASGRETFLIL